MPSYDEQLQLVEFGEYKSPRNIKYNIGSLKTYGATMGAYFAQVFDICDGIPTGTMSYGPTASTYKVEHYYPQTGKVEFETISCFHFENFVIKVNNNVSSEKLYLKYYKLQPSKDNIANHYRFIYTTQKLSDVDTFTLDGYYGVNGWELLILTNIDVSNTYRFKKKPDDEYTQLINKEYYELTTKTKNLEQVGSDPMTNITTGNELYKIKFPSFYVQNQSVIRLANRLTSDKTQYKLANNKDINGIEVLPQNSDNLGYEDLTNNKFILFNGFDNNYQLISIQKDSTSIAFSYIDLETQKKHVVWYDLQTKDKIYIVKRSQNIISYNNNNFITYAFEDCNYNSSSKITTKNDFVYTITFNDNEYDHILELNGTTSLADFKDDWKAQTNTIYLSSTPNNLNGIYLDNGYYEDISHVSFSSINSFYQNYFSQQSYDILYNICAYKSDWDYITHADGTTIKVISALIANEKEYQFTPPQASIGLQYFINSINVNLSGMYWKLKDSQEDLMQKKDFQITEFKPHVTGISIVNKINNKPGFLPNYINLLSNFDVDSTAYAYDSYPGTLKKVGFSVSTDINSPLGWISETPYDLKYTGKKTQLSSYLRFGFESQINMPSEGYIIFLELGKSN